MTSTLPSEHKHPILVQISLEWFFDRMTSGVHGYATCSKEFGQYIQTLDPTEIYTHVYYPPETLSLSHIYPKTVWIEAVKKWEADKRRSEEERQKRFLHESYLNEIKKKYAQREEEIDFFLAALYRKFGHTPLVKNTSKKLLRMNIILMLSGKGDQGACKMLGIDSSTIEEFTLLPQPESDEEKLLQLLVQEPAPINTEPKVI